MFLLQLIPVFTSGSVVYQDFSWYLNICNNKQTVIVIYGCSHLIVILIVLVAALFSTVKFKLVVL